MKRIITLFTLALIAGMVALYGCADPLEPTGPNNTEPIYVVDTIRDIDTFIRLDSTIHVDTVILIDSTCKSDTITVIDTVTVIDTLLEADTIIHLDTVIIVDTVIDSDTIAYIDTITVIDTIIDTDTVINIDTITVIDTVLEIDTLTQTDTIILLDTITDVDTLIIVDTVIQADTITIVDTVVQTETVIVVVPDTTKEPLCGALSKNQQEIIWILKNPAGSYRLEFLADVESAQPNQTLTVEIGDQSYIWDPNANPDFTVDQTLADRTTIRISTNIPPARGHAINVCLNVTKL